MAQKSFLNLANQRNAILNRMEQESDYGDQGYEDLVAVETLISQFEITTDAERAEALKILREDGDGFADNFKTKLLHRLN